MKDARTVVLDNEAVQVLLDVAHPGHRRLMAHVLTVTKRNRRRTGAIRLVVPTAVRVEAGWDRQAPRAAGINRLDVEDVPLGADAADRAVRARAALGISVADGHVAAVLAVTPGPHLVLTSDADDFRRIAGHLDLPLSIVEL